MKMNKKLLFLLAFSGLLALSGVAHGDTINIPNPLCLPGGTSCINSFGELIAAVSRYILGFISVLAVIVFIWAGILFVVSRGDPGKIKEAQHMVLYAVIGIGIAVAGEGLIRVVQAVIGPTPSP